MRNTRRRQLRKGRHLSTAGKSRWQWLNTGSSVEQWRALVQERIRKHQPRLRVIRF